jgi:hypothetical protein
LRRALHLVGSILALAAPAAAAPIPPVRLPPVNLGASSFMDAMGRPGIFVHEYVGLADARRFVGSDGQTLPGENSVFAVAALTHVAFTLPQDVLGGHWGAEVLLPVVHVHIHTGPIDARANGLGDLIVSPIVFQVPKLSVFDRPLTGRLALTFVLPTGRYHSDAPVNIGNNVFSFNPHYAFTFLITDRFETSWRFNYLFSSANASPPIAYQASSIQPGQAVHFNGAFSYALWPEFRAGVSGYYFKQITDSAIDGQALANAKEQVAGMGPGVMLTVGTFRTVVNGYWEFAVRNRPAGTRWSLNVSYAW